MDPGGRSVVVPFIIIAVVREEEEVGWISVAGLSQCRLL